MSTTDKITNAVAERMDYLLYFAIAFLTAWQLAKWAVSVDALAGASLAGLIALKAKRSKAKE